MTSQEQNNQTQQWNAVQAMPDQKTVVPPQEPSQIKSTPVPVKSVNIDLLSDIDFSVNNSLATPATPTLQPLQPVPKIDDHSSELSVNTHHASPAKQSEIPLSPTSIPSVPSQVIPPALTPIDRKSSVDNISVCSDVSSIDPNFDWESASLRNEEGSSVLGKGPNVESNAITNKYKDAFDDPKILKWFHKEVERLEKFIETSTIKTLNGTTPLDGKWKELQDSLVNVYFLTI